MAYSNEIKIMGEDTVYVLHPNLKKYTLLDMGFTQKPNGSYVFERVLNSKAPFGPGPKLKVTIKQDLSAFKMATVSANGMQKINIFNQDNKQDLSEQYHFLIDQFMDREVIAKK